MTPTKAALLILVAGALSLSGLAPGIAAATVVFLDNFNDGDISDWALTVTEDSVFGCSAAKCVSAPFSAHMQSLGEGRATGTSPIYSLDLSRNYKVAFSFMVPHADNHWFEVFNNHQTYLVIDDDTNLNCYTSPPSTSYFIKTLNADQWYLIEMQINPAADEYYVYIDGQFQRTCPMWIHDGWEASFRIGDRADGSTDKGEAYWDDFVITQGPVGDLDYDCDVDLADFVIFAEAISGPGQPIVPPADPAADLDGDDDDCDLHDFAIFVANFTGPL